MGAFLRSVGDRPQPDDQPEVQGAGLQQHRQRMERRSADTVDRRPEAFRSAPDPEPVVPRLLQPGAGSADEILRSAAAGTVRLPLAGRERDQHGEPARLRQLHARQGIRREPEICPQCRRVVEHFFREES